MKTTEFICNQCNKNFKNIKALRSHENYHNLQYKEQAYKGSLKTPKGKNNPSSILKQKREAIYMTHPNHCTGCNKSLLYEARSQKFCSKSCSAKFNNSQRDVKYHTGVSDAQLISINKRNQENRKNYLISPKKCICCLKTIPYEKRANKTCSRDCWSKNAQTNALKQETHGGGKCGYYKGIKCDSTWELATLVYHIDHNIPIKRCTDIKNYVYKNKDRKYIPDFVISGIIYEIKGYMTEKSRAKLDQNSDVLLYPKDKIMSHINYVKTTYSVKDLTKLYD